MPIFPDLGAKRSLGWTDPISWTTEGWKGPIRLQPGVQKKDKGDPKSFQI